MLFRHIYFTAAETRQHKRTYRKYQLSRSKKFVLCVHKMSVIILNTLLLDGRYFQIYYLTTSVVSSLMLYFYERPS